LRRFKLGFKPLRSDLPIYVAALTPKSLRQIGELADGWLPTHWPRVHLREGIDEISRAAEIAGRDPRNIEVAPFVNVVANDDVSRARNEARLPLAYYIGGMGDFYHASLSRLGFSEEADRVRELWQAGKPRSAIAAVSDAMVDQIAIVGTIENCKTAIDEMYSKGATLPLVPIPSDGSVAEKCSLIEELIG